MLTAPLPHALHFVGASDNVAVLWFPSPLALAGVVTGLTTLRGSTVALVVAVAVIGREQLPAMQALTATGLDAHRERETEEKRGALEQTSPLAGRRKAKKEEKSLENWAKKNEVKKIKFSTASLLEEETAAHNSSAGP